MSFAELYKRKLMTAEEAVRKIHSHDEIVVAVAASEPPGLLSKLHTVKDQVEDVSVVMVLPLGEYDYYMKPEMKGHFMLNAWYYGGGCRKVIGQGTVAYNPTHLHNCMAKRIDVKNPRIFFGTAAPMDKNGCLNLSLGIMVEKDAIENADLVVIEVNENLPRTHGDTLIHIRDVDVIVENHRPVPALPAVVPSEKDKLIGQYIAELVEDGSTIQLGIGGMPNAVGDLIAHSNVRDLGMHTEMLVDAYLTMHEKGKLTNKYKSWDKGKGAWTFCMGSQKLYDWVDRNPSLASYPSNYTNDPKVIAQIDNFISVNNCVEVDLYGQVSSESAGTRQISGTGGQLDFVTGAYLSNGGKSFICFRSAFEDRKTGQAASRVVPALPPSSIVTVPRTQVHYLVTEWGKVNLAGCSTWERAERIISISHPDFRDELIKQAETMKIWRRSNRI